MMVVLDSGVLGRPELTVVIDVATRTIAAAVLRPSGTKAVDAVLLFAVLTCIPTDTGQRQLVTELTRVLRPGGLLYVSDLLL